MKSSNQTIKPACPPHKPNGWKCLVAHYKGGVLQPDCDQCSECGHWIPHGKLEDPCRVCIAEEKRERGICSSCDKPAAKDGDGTYRCECGTWWNSKMWGTIAK